ncbi:MAG TPA: alpha-amylase family glycosyl hydrolase, partial [Thermomonospora sp.]|nr:alpha-amylase family glycosyl hydrolase [Thermomonospora sp.]
GEGSADNPALCYRGLADDVYYRHHPHDPSRYVDTTGTGNSLEVRSPQVLRLVMDSLRWWVTEMHVDGFRFDLASALARELHDVDRLAAFFDLVQQDPVVSQVKLIAEPWDVGEGGYQVGNFPPLWTEWNGKYRDTVRDYWRGGYAAMPEFASRLTGSSDLYEHDNRRPIASINFVTCHDGFTLTDLVSYNHKHNDANGEGNRDGTDDNRSWNCGYEGPTDNPEILELRARQRRNFLATLFLSQGVPMLTAGDELGRTQRGNNNAYCQDNEISWVDWSADDGDLEFVRRLAKLRRDHPVFRRRRFFQGRGGHGGLGDIAWLTPAGEEMTDGDWHAGYAKSLGVFLNGEAITEPDPRGRPVRDDSFLLLVNAHSQAVEFTLPGVEFGERWEWELDTAGRAPDGSADRRTVKADGVVEVAGRSLVVLRRL